MYLKMYKKYGAVLSSLFLAAQSINAQTDSLFLTIDQLFERGGYSIVCNFRRM